MDEPDGSEPRRRSRELCRRVTAEHCYVVYTEHPGEDFHLTEGPLEGWAETEADEGAL